MRAQPLIQLWDCGVLGLIVACPSGVVYSNQTGGYACRHPELEGVFVPLNDADIDTRTQFARLDEHFFYGPKWQGHCYNGIDAETADFLDAFLESSPVTRGIAVDREKLALSHEAWIHVLFASGDDADEAGRFVGFGQGRGVLTWPNSD